MAHNVELPRSFYPQHAIIQSSIVFSSRAPRNSYQLRNATSRSVYNRIVYRRSYRLLHYLDQTPRLASDLRYCILSHRYSGNFHDEERHAGMAVLCAAYTGQYGSGSPYVPIPSPRVTHHS